MTNEVKKQISDLLYDEEHLDKISDLSLYDAAVYGAELQDPIAFRRGVQAAIDKVKSLGAHLPGSINLFIVEELERLKG
jgi:hypothetical protein